MTLTTMTFQRSLLLEVASSIRERTSSSAPAESCCQSCWLGAVAVAGDWGASKKSLLRGAVGADRSVQGRVPGTGPQSLAKSEKAAWHVWPLSPRKTGLAFSPSEPLGFSAFGFSPWLLAFSASGLFHPLGMEPLGGQPLRLVARGGGACGEKRRDRRGDAHLRTLPAALPMAPRFENGSSRSGLPQEARFKNARGAFGASFYAMCLVVSKQN